MLPLVASCAAAEGIPLDGGRVLPMGMDRPRARPSTESSSRDTNPHRPSASSPQEQGAKCPELGVDDDAYTVLRIAEGCPAGPARDRAWARAAELYAAMLESIPQADSAAEAAFNGAYAFTQVGRHGEAQRLYERFIGVYGAPDDLEMLRRADADAQSRIGLSAERHIGSVRQAHFALASLRLMAGDMVGAADYFRSMAKEEWLDGEDRRQAARNGMVLYARLRELDRLRECRRIFRALERRSDRLAEVEITIALGYSFDQFDPRDRANEEVRRDSIRELQYVEALIRRDKESLRSDKSLPGLAVQTSASMARLIRPIGDSRAPEACARASRTYRELRRRLGNPPVRELKAESEMAAACAYRLLDERLKNEWDPPDRHRYGGPLARVAAQVLRDRKRADELDGELQEVIADAPSSRWAVAAGVRRATLYETCREALARAPVRPDDLVFAARRDRLIEEIDRIAVRHHVQALLRAQTLGIEGDEVNRSLERLALLADRHGDAYVRSLADGVEHPQEPGHPFEYRPGMFRMHPGKLLPTADLVPLPLPAAIR